MSFGKLIAQKPVAICGIIAAMAFSTGAAITAAGHAVGMCVLSGLVAIVLTILTAAVYIRGD